MPSGKRRPRADDASDSEQDDSTTPSKRARLEGQHLQNGSAATARDEYDRVDSEDAGDAEKAEDKATAAATQRLQMKRQGKPQENVAAEGGTILKVECRNFMCHRDLRVEFGPFMNFVCGHNGSGKSAVLTAITLCLGGKTAATNRGSALKTFIKEGEDTAQVSVTLKNGGDGFKKDIYGDEVTVLRKFTLDGSSSYRIKSKQGRTISTKRQDLDDLTDFYALQVDNPLTVLTQDAARQFLSQSTNDQKYAFFTKGVQLAQLDQDYEILRQGIENINAQIKRKLPHLHQLRQKEEAAKAKHDTLKSHEASRNRFQELGRQMAWCQVEERESELDASVERLATLEAQLGEGDKGKMRVEDAFERSNVLWADAKKKLEEAQAARLPHVEEQRELQERFARVKTDLRQAQIDEREIENMKTKTVQDETNVRNEITKEQERLAERDGGTEALTAEQAAAETKAAELRDKLAEIEIENRSDVAKREEIQNAVKQAKQRIDAKNEELRRQEEVIAELERSKSDPFAAFPRNMHNLLRAIQQERRFRDKPIGPIGLHVKLRQPEWVDVVERVLPGLGGFIVTNHADGVLLKSLMAQQNCVVQYNVTPTKEISPVEPDGRYRTILRILEIDSELVRNYLIINASIEQAILIPNLDEANSAMGSKTPADNITVCYALNRQRKGWGHQVGGSRGSMGVAPLKPWQGKNRIRVDDNEAPIQRARQHQAQLQAELANLQGEHTRLIQEHAQHDRKIAAYRNKRTRLTADYHQWVFKVDEIKGKIEEIGADGRIASFEARLQEILAEQEHNANQYDSFLKEWNRLNEESASINKRVKEVKQDIVSVTRQIEEAESEVATTTEMRAKALRAKNDYFDNLGHMRNEVESEKANKEECQARVEEWIEEALKISDRVPVPAGETQQTLDSKLEKIQKEIHRAEAALGGTKEEILAAYEKAKNEAGEMKEQLKSFEKLVLVQKRVYDDRKRRWVLFQRYISARARSQFMLMMSERGYTGRLRLEHKNNPPELIIEVQPGGDEAGNRGPKTLSGGEKSFSTICLLLSLWEAMGSPIRCLDEFDVFMDPINRQMSVKLMIDNAERSIGRQFILITPQNMSTVRGKNVKVYRMADPVRGGQRRLDE